MRRSKKSLGSAILVSVLSASMVIATPASVFAKTFTENEKASESDISDGIVAPPKSDITVNGSVHVKPNSGQSVKADNANVKVTGEVNADINASNGAKVTVGENVNGDVVNNEGNIDINGDLNGRLDNLGGTSNVKGNITTVSDSEYGDTAVDGSKGTVTVTGNVSLDSKKGGDAISIYGNHDANVTINGDITSKSSDKTITILGENGDVKKNVFSNGIGIMSDGGEKNVTVKGNANVSSNAFASGITVETYDTPNEDGTDVIKSTVNITTGNISVNAAEEVNDYVTNNLGKLTTDTAKVIEIYTESNGEINVVVKGDATSSGDHAISIKNAGEIESGKTNIAVDGTLKSSKNAIVIVNDDKANSTVEITTWKIEGDTTKNVVVKKNDHENGELVEDEAASKKQSENINYIIRHEGTISLEGTRPVTVNGNKFETARETEKLTIHVKVDDDKKYRVDRVEGGTATATKNADGSWTLIVPKNGGVDIRAVLVAIEQTKHNSSSSSGGGSSSSRPGVSNAASGMTTTTTDGATVQTNVTKNNNSTTTAAAVRIGTTTANVTSSVSEQNGTKVTFQNASGNLAGASFKTVGQISADGTTLVKEDGTTAKMATGMLLSIENADGTSVGCFVDATGKTIATGAFEVYYMLGTDGKLHAHFVNPQGYFMTGIQVINGQTVTFNTVGEMVSVL